MCGAGVLRDRRIIGAAAVDLEGSMEDEDLELGRALPGFHENPSAEIGAPITPLPRPFPAEWGLLGDQTPLFNSTPTGFPLQGSAFLLLQNTIY